MRCIARLRMVFIGGLSSSNLLRICHISVHCPLSFGVIGHILLRSLVFLLGGGQAHAQDYDCE
jgi:hypothetical protein